MLRLWADSRAAEDLWCFFERLRADLVSRGGDGGHGGEAGPPSWMDIVGARARSLLWRGDVGGCCGVFGWGSGTKQGKTLKISEKK